MIIEEVDRVTLTRMNMALEQICHRFPDEQFRTHPTRSHIARAILTSVRAGDRTLDGMILAGRRSLARLRDVRHLTRIV